MRNVEFVVTEAKMQYNGINRINENSGVISTAAPNQNSHRRTEMATAYSTSKARKNTRRPQRKINGLSGSRAYSSWVHMLDRCENPASSKWPRYGGRGIAICERWHIFENFYGDMGDPPATYTLDRIDNDGNYSPENCRWASRQTQNLNRSTSAARTGKSYEVDGQVHSISDWANEVGISQQAIYSRLKRGWSIEEALTTPARKGSSKTRSLRRKRKLQVSESEVQS